MVCRKQMWIDIVYIFISCHLVKQVQGKWPTGCEIAIIQDESCFLTSDHTDNYDDAAETCSRVGGTIAMMKNSLIQSLIVKKNRRSNVSVGFWAGITDISKEGTFRYEDQNRLGSFQPWAKNQPNNGGLFGSQQDCVVVSINDEQWYDEDCSKYAYFACEFKQEANPCKIKNVFIPHAEYKSCYTEDQFPYGTILPIKCHDGYILLGPNYVTCLADEKWSTQPQCVKGCPPPKQPAHAVLLNLKDTYTLGSKLMYICNDGYVTTKEKKSHSQLTCGSNGKWLPENNGCSLEYTIGTMDVATTNTICGIVDLIYPHPWVVSLWQKDEIAPFCYGTLIHESWVVTTAQCLAGLIRKRDLHIYVRFHNERNPFVRNFINNEVHIVKIHPKYSKRFHANDIGILQLKRPVHFTRSVRPICLSERDLTLKQPCEQFTLLKGTVVGWGPLEKDDYDVASVMNESMSIVMSQSNCFKSDQSHVENIMCTIKTPGTRTTFAGDTGSPMELLWKDQYHLLGIYSWGERAAHLGEHDYFTKINEYVSWLKSFIEK